MSKQRSKQQKTTGKDASRRRGKHDDSDKSAEDQGSAFAAVRETVESIVIAFVLAFLFRTFEAEAFVIPTGSMAPTLLGANKDVDCEECGYAYQASASSENNDGSQGNVLLKDREVVGITCPNCYHTMTVAPYSAERDAALSPTYSGDRILVDKISYQIGEPQRWDVFVFKYPNESATNYIKRLVGLPDETLRIFRGDIFVKAPEAPDDSFHHARRSHIPKKLLSMCQIVYDNQHLAKTLVDGGWPRRWTPDEAVGEGAWIAPPIAFDGNVGRQVFESDGSIERDAWIRYRHLVPTFQQWEAIRDGSWKLPPGQVHSGQLITDGYAYNTNSLRASVERGGTIEPNPQAFGLNWVGDLVVDCQVDVLEEGGELLLELVEGGRVFQCRINLQDGKATLWIDGAKAALATASTKVKGVGSYQIALANVDSELLLWVDDSLVEFDAATTYPDDGFTAIPDSRDLRPAAIGARGAKLRVHRIRLMRDIYYIAAKRRDSDMWDMKSNPHIRHWPGSAAPYRMSLEEKYALRDERLAFLSSPRLWTATEEATSLFDDRNFRQAIFENGEDQFMPMGDNSPMSQDGRIWPGASHTVDRDLLIGKALYIYWPHAWNSPVPFWPNWGRMKLVR